MHCELLSPRSDAWMRCLDEVRHDFYHLPAYVTLCAEGYEGGTPCAFLARNDDGLFLLPLIVRPISERAGGRKLFDAVGPYGYGSPIFCMKTDRDRSSFLVRAIESMIDCLRGEQIITAFSRLHPMLDVPLDPLRHHGAVVSHGETVFCDLRLSQEELWHQTRDRLRTHINKCRNAGFVAEEDRDWRFLDAFCEIYTETMRRVGAAEFYYFDRAYFERLRNDLPENMHLLVVRSGDELASAGFFSETCGIVQYHLSGTGQAFLRSESSHFLLHFGREWAKTRGNELYHLGGGVGAAKDSLFQFKAGYSKLRARFSTWRLIIDYEAYRELLALRQIEVGGLQPAASEFFPAYRKYSAVGCLPEQKVQPWKS